MANEIQAPYGRTGRTVYAVIRNAVGQVWNGAFFENYSAAQYVNYAVLLAEQGAGGVYVGSVPALVTAAGVYGVTVHDRAGGSPAEGDPIVAAGEVHWDGAAVVPRGELLTPAEAAGRPTTLRGMIRRVFEWAANKRTRDRGDGTVLLRNAADGATLEAQTQSTSGDVDTISAGA